MVLETERLVLRKLTEQDFSDLCKILQDEEVMYAYEHAFLEEEVWAWLDKQLNRYAQYGFGLWAAILKETGELIGQAGLTMQDCDGKEVLEIGYLFQKAFGTKDMLQKRQWRAVTMHLKRWARKKFIPLSVTTISLRKMWQNGVA